LCIPPAVKPHDVVKPRRVADGVGQKLSRRCTILDKGFTPECPALGKDHQISRQGRERTLSAVLTADIDLENEEWIPFNPQNGYVTSAYAGTFDGAGHTISGLSINDSSTNGVGLFGTVNSATIKNLKVEGTVSATKSGYVGGIVGKRG